MAKTLYDPRCADLARYFLDPLTDDALVEELAGVIQEAIEDWDRNRRDKETENETDSTDD